MEGVAGYSPANFRRVQVQDSAVLAEVARELSVADALGIDLEMAQRVERKPGGQQTWIHLLALIQIASESLSVVIDPLRCKDLTPLRPLLGGPTRKVFLGGGQDAALLEGSGIPARRIVDVGEIALSVFGRREDGMAALSHRIFGLSLDKTVRRADWLARPINPVLLAYAHRDAELTLLIYRWFQTHYGSVVLLHERDDLEPRLPEWVPVWLMEAMRRPSSDALAIVMEQSLNPDRDGDRMTQDVRALRESGLAPRQLNRLIRICGDVGLTETLPQVLEMADSPLSLVRSSVARAVGQLAAPEAGAPVLDRLAQDPLEEVRKAAESARRELNTTKQEAPIEAAEEPTGALNEENVSLLQALLKQLENESG